MKYWYLNFYLENSTYITLWCWDERAIYKDPLNSVAAVLRLLTVSLSNNYIVHFLYWNTFIKMPIYGWTNEVLFIRYSLPMDIKGKKVFISKFWLKKNIETPTPPPFPTIFKKNCWCQSHYNKIGSFHPLY